MYWTKVFMSILKIRGLRQSRWRTPFCTGMKRVMKEFVIAADEKSEYRIIMTLEIWSGIWWYFRMLAISECSTSPNTFFKPRRVI